MTIFRIASLLVCLLFSDACASTFKPVLLNKKKQATAVSNNKREFLSGEKEYENAINTGDLEECLACDELRWAVICEYYGWLSAHYPNDKVGGSTGMVIISGKNCTPHGPGTASAGFTGADGKEYSFSHARHSACANASALFHDAQYFLFFSREGKTLREKYAAEIKKLKQLNRRNKGKKASVSAVQEYEDDFNIGELEECIACDELRWAVICEYYGWLSAHYPNDKEGGSTGIVIINGKNCTPHGSGTASARFTGADGKEYSFSHARHSSCTNASALFHNAQYFLFFSREGKTLREKYAAEIKKLKQLNRRNKGKKASVSAVQEYEDDFNIGELEECLACDELRWAVICEYYGWLSAHYPNDKEGGSTGMVIINGKNCTPHGSGTASARFTGADGKEYSFSHARHSSCTNASALFHNAQYFLFFTPEGKALKQKYNSQISKLRRLNRCR